MIQLRINPKITSSSTTLERYFQDIRKEKRITQEEEVELARRIKKGDQIALEKLTKANLLFVVSVAKQYQHRGLSLPELINEGNLGMVIAAHKFDETRGFKFISFAVFWIRQQIILALAEHKNIIRLPLNQIKTANKSHYMADELMKRNGGAEPTLVEIIEELESMDDTLKLDYEKVANVFTLAQKHSSLDNRFSSNDDDEGNSLLDIIPDENSINPIDDLMKESLNMEIRQLISTLPKKDAELIRKLFGIDRPAISTAQLAEEASRTVANIGARKKIILKKLKIKFEQLHSN